MNEKQHSGLMTQTAQVPLEGVRIDARLAGLCSEMTVTQRYRNTEAVDVEAVYVFPLEEGAAVCGFEARVGDRVIRGRVEEREKAFETYDDAMAAGHGAFLLDQERPNVFTASVGNLKPGQSIEITIRTVALLSYEGAAVRLLVPTTVSPRYVPAGPPEVGEPDGDRVNPPRQDAVPYGLTLNVEVDLGSRVSQIDSPSHQVRTTLLEKKAIVTLSSDSVALDRDFVLLVKPEDAHRPVGRVAREADGTLSAMVSFHPDPTGMPSGGKEVLFLLDCSGSMMGDSIEQAKRALALCVRALSEGDTFNIVRFGSSHSSLWPSPQSYDQANLEAATRHVQGIGADLGGTEILAPMQRLLELPPDTQRPRQVLLLTDGEVSNEADVIELCKKHRQAARIFAFGIGAGVSEHLVRGVARASNGAAEFIYPGERIEPKVLRMFGRVNSPSFKSVTVDWRGLDVEAAPAECPPVFGGESLTVFGRIKSGTTDRVVLRADEHSWEVPLDLAAPEDGGPIPTLWARHRIRDLEAGHGAPVRGSQQGRRREDRTAGELVELGKRYGLMSSATSYVAVEERSDEDKTKTQAELRKVPVAITKGWHGRGSVLSQFGTLSGAAPGGMARAITMAAMPPPSAAFGGAPMPTAAMYDQDEACEMEEDTGAWSGMAAPRQRPQKAKTSKPSLLKRLFSANEDVLDDAKPMEPEPAMAPPPAPSVQARPGRSGGAAATADRLFELLMTQRADGSFRISAELRGWLGSRVDAVAEAAAKEGEALVATAVVLELLRREAAERADEWGPAAAKAERWLAHQARAFDAAALLGA
jgi:Ca-activated chloride channel homolog